MNKMIVKLLVGVLFVFGAIGANAQVTVTNPTNTTPNLAATYGSLAAAITAVNAITAISGPVTITLTAANPQTAPAGGYSITAIPTGASATNIIVFEGSGNTITAFTPQTSGNTNDAIFKLIGADFITIQNFTMQENAANTTTTLASNNMTEWGVALLYASTTNGAQNNIIQNNTISLNRTYLNTFGIYSNTRHSATAVTTTAEVTTAAGSNSGNKVYTNSISNVNYGIVFIGAGTTLAAIDNGNDIGGSSAGTGNTITNWGGGAAPTGYISLTGNNYCIFDNQQINDNVSFNTITSASLTQSVTTGGILKNYSVASPTSGTITTTINNNTVQITNNTTGTTTGGVIGINNQGLTPLLSTATMSMNNNTVRNCVLGGTTATTAGITAITNLSLPGTMNMNGNTILNNAISATSSTSGINAGISNSGAAGTLNINNNIIRSLASTAASGQIQAIANSGAIVTALNINSNALGNATSGLFSTSTATSGTLFGIVSSGGAATCALSIQSNDIRGITYNTTASAGQSYIQNTAATLSQNLSSNTFTNLSVNTTGSVTFIANDVALPTGGSLTASSNSIVTAFSKTAAGGTVTLYLTSNSPSSVTTTTKTEQNNNFSNITVTGATTINGWMDIEGATAGLTKNISNNTFSNWTGGSSAITALQVGYCLGTSSISSNTISNITGTGAITGISLLSNNVVIAGVSSNTITGLSSTGTGGAITAISSASPTVTINTNTISSLSSASTTATVAGITSSGANSTIRSNTINTLSCVGSTSGVTNGIMVTAGTTVNVFKNKIYDLSTTGAFTTTPGVNGIVLSGSTSAVTANVYNNLIGDLKAGTSASTDAIRGISVTATGTTSSYNMYYNTVNLAATSTGANFGSSGIFHTTSTTATTAVLNLRNNIIVNTSTPAGTGLTVAYRRSSGVASTLANYASTSNNNLFYAGTPGASNLIYSDGTGSAQTLALYKSGVFTAGTIAPRDANSISENPTFVSTTGSDPNFLHINTSVYTPINGGAGTGTGITDDYDGDSRSGSNPDIGADEFTGTCAPPQPTSLVLTTTGANINGSFTAATPAPSGYLVVRTVTNTAPTPTDGATYTAGAGTGTLTGAYVESVGTATSFVSSSGLIGGNTYYYWVFSYGTLCAANPTYNTTNPLTNSIVAPSPCVTPVAQPTSLNLVVSSGSTLSGSFTAASPAASGYLVVRSTSNSEPAPVNGTVYTVGSAALGAGTYVESVGTGTSFNSTGLSGGTTYYYFVYSYAAGCSGEPFYLSGTSVPAIAALTNSATTLSCPVAGTYSVGPTGTYTSIGQVINTLTGCTLTGPVVFELQSTYNSGVETFPITIPALAGSSATNTVTFRPETGATNLSITSSNATGILSLTGANYIRFDGRAGGAGTNKDLTIENTNNSAAYGVRFLNGASNNSFTYCNIKNASTSSTVGAVLFSTSTVSGGNSNNTIDNCDINAFVGAAAGNVCIYSAGTVGNENANNIISNNNIHDYVFRGIDIATTGSNAFTITANNFYNGTVSGALNYAAAGSLHGLRILGGVGYTITNNFIGGSAAGATGANASYTATAGALSYTGISISSGTGTASDVKGNTVRGITLSCVPTAASTLVFIGISTGGTGTVNVGGNGVGDGNTIGSNSVNGSISVTTSTTSTTNTSQVHGINSGGAGNLIAGNQVGGIDINNIGTSPANGTFFGIVSLGTATTPPMVINNNIVGSTGGGAAINSVRFLSTTTATGSGFVGITHQVSANAVNITNNTIKNLTNQSTTSSGFLNGILISSSVTNAVTVSGNTIDAISSVTNNSASAGSYLAITTACTGSNTFSNNIITNINQAGTGTSVTIRGISTTAGVNTITGNNINNLTTTSTATGVSSSASIIGISQTSTTAGQTVSGNTIHSLSNTAAVSSIVGVVGIYYSGPTTGTNLVAKNFVHSNSLASTSVSAALQGIYSGAGTTTYQNNMVRLGNLSTSTGYIINGINDAAGTNNYYFNSVYIGGTGVPTGGSNTFAFTSAVTTNTRVFQNNIFYNARSNAAGTAKHYAVSVAGTAANPAGLTINYNDYYVSGTGGVLGLFNAVDRTDIGIWRTAVGQDVNSVSGNPQYTTPDGTAATVNLHINPAIPTIVEATGLAIGSVTDDIDGDTRASFTPTDMGADAGNFTAALANDIAAVAFVSPANGGSAIQNVSFTPQASFINNGTATQTNVTVRYKILDAGLTEVYNQTAIIASMAPGIVTTASFPSGSIPGSGTYTIQAIAELAGDGNTANDQVNGTLNVLSQLSGDYVVGASQSAPFNTITNAIARLNLVGISAPVRFLLSDASYSASETFPITINSIFGASAVNTFTIKPQITAAISGSSASALFVLNGADYVTIDGSTGATANTICPVSAASTDLTLTNTNSGASSAVIWLQTAAGPDGATNNTVKNCILVGNSNTSTLFGVGSGSSTISATSAGTGNNNNQYVNNNISKTQYGIYSGGASSGNKNTGTVINQNIINTASPNNVGIGGILVGFENNININRNNISEINGTSDRFGISVGFGTSFIFTTTVASEVTNATITKNIIGNIIGSGTNSSIGIAVGAATSGTTLVANNMISGVNHNATPSDVTAGIALGGGTGSVTQVYYNTVVMQGTMPAGTAGSSVSACLAVTAATAPTLDMRNNIFINKQVGNTSATTRFVCVALGYSSTTGNYAGLTSDHNSFYSAGAGPGTYHVGITGGVNSTSRTTLTDWTTETGRDGSGTTLQVNAVFNSSTDLHILSTDPANTTLNNAGVAISVTDDIDCDNRVAPGDIGADEFTPPACVTAVGGTATGNATFCTSGTPTITASGYSTGNGTTYQWYTSTVIGDYPNAGTAVAGQTNPAALVTGVVSATKYYWLRVTCATNTSTDNSTMVTVTINPSAVNISGPSAKCVNDPAVTLTENAGTGTSWLWSPGGQTTQSISVNPSSTTTYTVQVTSPGGCVITSAGFTVTVNPNPTGVTATPSTTTICPGGTINLSSSATTPSSTILSEGFETGASGWVFTDSLSSGSAVASQIFHIENAPYTDASGSATFSNFSVTGSKFAYSNPDAGGGSSSQTRTFMTSPSFSTVGYTGTATLTFKNIYRYWSSSSPVEQVKVQITSDGGTTWNDLVNYNGADVGTTTNNAQVPVTSTITIPAGYIGLPSVKLRWRYLSNWGYFWIMDDVLLTGTPLSYSYSWTSTPAGFTSSLQNPTAVTPASSGTTYTVAVSGLGGCSTSATTAAITFGNTWIGTTPDGAIAGNWSCGLPTGTTDVIIPTTPAGGNMPVLTANLDVRDIKLQPSATIDLGGQTLTINGAISGTGSIKGSATSNLTLAGTAGTLNFTSGSQSLNNLSLGSSSSATVGSALDVYGTIALTSASLNLNAQHLTLKSNSTNTARIADLTGSTLSGATNVTMERYIKLRAGNSGRAYRLLAPTVNTAGSMRLNWMENGLNTAIGTNDDPVPTYGTQISGAGGNANGFDKTQTNQSSIYATANAVTPTYSAIGSTGGTLNALTGYFMYVRGDRAQDMTIPLAPNMPTSATTLRTTGSLVTGTQTSFTNAFTGGGALNLVTNPYPSPIDWSLVKAASSNITDYYTLWDPNFGTRGGFVTVSSAGVASSGLATQFIQSGQAFFVESDGGVPAVSIQEGHKAAGNNNEVFLTPPPPVEGFRTELYFTEPNNYRRVVDGALAVFNNGYSAAVDAQDAKEINNWDENIAIARDGKHLAIEARPVILSKDTLPLFMNNMKQQAYEFEFTPALFSNPNLKAELIDNYLNTRTLLSVVNPTTVSFTVNADAGSKATDRFMVVFGSFSGPLAIDAISIKANKKNNGVQVDWTSKSETDMASYEVERSTFGANFAKVNTTAAIGNSSTPVNYGWFDATPVAGTNFYRIKAIDRAGNIKYSDIVQVTIGKGEPGIVVYPNPMQGHTFKMDMNNLAKGSYQLSLYNNMGQLVYTEMVQHDGSQSTKTIDLKHDIAKGAYQLQLSGSNGFKTTQRIIKN